MARYAEGTKVSVDSSRGEIMGILAKHKVLRQAVGTEPEGDTVQFELNGRVYRLLIKRPTLEEVRRNYTGHHSYVQDWQAKVDAEWRRRWRANVLLLKAKMEFADDGDTTSIEREMLPYLVLKDGRTLEAAMDSLPMLTAGGSRG